MIAAASGKKRDDLADGHLVEQDSADAVVADAPPPEHAAKKGSLKATELQDGGMENEPFRGEPDADGTVSEDNRWCLASPQHLTSLCCLLVQCTVATRLCVCRQFTFSQVPDHVMLRIFRDIDAVTRNAVEQDGSGGHWYQHVSDDTLTVLTDGYQRRCGLPQVCKHWDRLLSQPSFVWAYLNLGFHELWDVQQAS